MVLVGLDPDLLFKKLHGFTGEIGGGNQHQLCSLFSAALNASGKVTVVADDDPDRAEGSPVDLEAVIV